MCFFQEQDNAKYRKKLMHTLLTGTIVNTINKLIY